MRLYVNNLGMSVQEEKKEKRIVWYCVIYFFKKKPHILFTFAEPFSSVPKG
jgi:hypothetical protein